VGGEKMRREANAGQRAVGLSYSAHSAKVFVSRKLKSYAEMQFTTMFVTPSVQRRKKQRKLIALECHRTEEKRRDLRDTHFSRMTALGETNCRFS
jgi:hypothetical protein